jgi:hypothetical protein
MKLYFVPGGLEVLSQMALTFGQLDKQNLYYKRLPTALSPSPHSANGGGRRWRRRWPEEGLRYLKPHPHWPPLDRDVSPARSRPLAGGICLPISAGDWPVRGAQRARRGRSHAKLHPRQRCGRRRQGRRAVLPKTSEVHGEKSDSGRNEKASPKAALFCAGHLFSLAPSPLLKPMHFGGGRPPTEDLIVAR